MINLIPGTNRHRTRPLLTGVAVFCALLLNLEPCRAQAPEARSSQQSDPKPGITTEGQKGAQRSRGADGTREFLGLGAPPDAAAAERGSKIFASSCSFCHGAKATGGDTGPDLVRSSLVLHDEKGELIGPVIHKGRVDRGMPQFASFSNAELYDLAEFLHQRVELAANRGTYQILNVLTGDPKAGEAWFRGAGGCSNCHSATGDLAHIGTKLSPPDLQQTLLYPASRARSSGSDREQKATVSLPSGEKITGTLKKLDDFRVILLDKAGDFHSIALTDGITVKLEDPLAAHRELLDKYTNADMHNITAYLATLK
ncbi:MAG: c-type cytochrome [Bryobacteraceae bacterium]